jgi:predicted dehydrogenase
MTAPYAGFHHGASFMEHVHMQECVRNARAAEVSLRDGLRSVAIGEAAHRSIVENRVVKMSEVMS